MKFKFNFKTDFDALKAGDKTAFNNLMEDFYGWSINEAKKTVQYDTERAHDVAVTFWEKLPEAIQRFDTNRASFLTWASTCIRNLAVNEIARNPRPAVYYGSEIEQNSDIDDPTLQLEALQDFDVVTSQLTPGQLDVFWRLVEGATKEEIIEELGTTDAAVRKTLERIRRVIRGQIEEE